MSSSSSRNPTPPSDIMTPESSNGDPPQSGFTAVNGGSPSHGNNTEDREQRQLSTPQTSQQHQPNHLADDDIYGTESEDSARKRKDSGEPSPAPSDANSLKRQRTADPNDSSPAFNSGSDDLAHRHSKDDHILHSASDNAAEHTQNEASWAMHERNTSVNSEVHLAEVLQSNMSADHMDGVQHHQDQRYRPMALPQPPSHYQQQAAQMQQSPTSAQMQKAARKRNFSNRTKTGCFTCRERKKKCDEAKPTCHNCLRGGFTCKGYQANTVFKSQMLRDQPLPLQSKTGWSPEHGPRFLRDLIVGSNHYDHLPSDNRRLPPSDDARESARSIPTPQEPTLGSSYGPKGWPEPAQSQQHFPRESFQRPDYHQQMPPLRSEISAQQTLPSHPPPLPVHPSHSRSMSQHAPPNGQSTQYTNGQSPQYIDQRLMAQTALEHTSSRQPSYEHLTERQKMTRQIPFVHNDPSLKEDREACAKEVYRYNKNSIEPKNLSDGARREQFRQIIECPDKGASPGTKARSAISPQSSERKGTLGLRIEVEAPFYCDYGYNLKIGSDVEIGANCRIMDAAHIEIGDRTIIGPNVTIITLDCDHHAPRGPKEKRLYIAKRIIIGEDVFIGAGAVVLPGVSIHKGATIGAGTIVHKDITSAVSVMNENNYKYGRYVQRPPPQY